MKWEKCKRCGSNRVIKRSSGGKGILLIIVGFFLLEMADVPNEGVSALLIISLVIGGIGTVLLLFTGRLVCKDCELQWVPKRATNKKASY